MIFPISIEQVENGYLVRQHVTTWVVKTLEEAFQKIVLEFEPQLEGKPPEVVIHRTPKPTTQGEP